MLNIYVSGGTKYLANMQIENAGNRKFQNKSSRRSVRCCVRNQHSKHYSL